MTSDTNERDAVHGAAATDSVPSDRPLRPAVAMDGQLTQHLQTIRIYYEDTDAAGIVYHARYLAYAERARTEALRALGVPHSELASQHGLIFMVRRAEMDYVRPARLDDLVDVTTGPWETRGASVEVHQGFRVGDREIARLRIGVACVRIADGRPARIPARWRMALGGFKGV